MKSDKVFADTYFTPKRLRNGQKIKVTNYISYNGVHIRNYFFHYKDRAYSIDACPIVAVFRIIKVKNGKN